MSEALEKRLTELAAETISNGWREDGELIQDGIVVLNQYRRKLEKARKVMESVSANLYNMTAADITRELGLMDNEIAEMLDELANSAEQPDEPAP